VIAWVFALGLGCGSAVPVTDEGASGSGSTTGESAGSQGPGNSGTASSGAGETTRGGDTNGDGRPSETTTATTSDPPPPTSTSGASSDSTETTASDTSDSTDDPCGDFICIPDVGPQPDDCSVWDQDCPAGEKCTAYANDGGPTWNDNRCVPIVPDPVGIGEACSVEEFPTSGFDDCALGSICVGQPEALGGVCTPFCGGDLASPTCPPSRSCVGSDVLPLCLLQCDPLAPGCGVGEGCFPIGDVFVCVGAGDVDAQGECTFANECVAGTACVFGGADDDCPEGADACCATYCDLAEPSCPGDAACVPFGDIPGFDDVGLCAAPA
jgi:hypothetical protein